MNKTSYIFILLTLILGILCSSAQHKAVYVPDNLDPIEDYLAQINNVLLKRVKGKHANRIKKVFKDRDEKVVEQINDSVYLFHEDLDGYLDGVLEEIYSSNPNVDHENYRFFIRNSIVPNASCYGDGMFDVYLGLLDTLGSDDEIAFVLCHEIAHKLLDHPLNNITKAVERLKSDETKKRVRDVKKQKYGRTRAALSIIDELNIDYLRHSKNIEAEADSLGFILFNNTKYNRSNAISALQRLERVDDMILSHPVKVDSVFNFADYPFKSFWIEKEISIFDSDDQINDYKMISDTLKTHPEVPFRIEKLIKEFQIDTSDFVHIGKDLEALSAKLQEQSIQTFIDLKRLDLAMYQVQKKYDQAKISKSAYAEKMMLILNEAYVLRKKHKLGKYIPQENNLSDEKELNTLRRFWNVLELKEIKAIGQHFYAREKEFISEEKHNQLNILSN